MNSFWLILPRRRAQCAPPQMYGRYTRRDNLLRCSPSSFMAERDDIAPLENSGGCMPLPTRRRCRVVTMSPGKQAVRKLRTYEIHFACRKSGSGDPVWRRWPLTSRIHIDSFCTSAIFVPWWRATVRTVPKVSCDLPGPLTQPLDLKLRSETSLQTHSRRRD